MLCKYLIFEDILQKGNYSNYLELLGLAFAVYNQSLVGLFKTRPCTITAFDHSLITAFPAIEITLFGANFFAITVFFATSTTSPPYDISPAFLLWAAF
jgi:hypothetical protein